MDAIFTENDIVRVVLPEDADDGHNLAITVSDDAGARLSDHSGKHISEKLAIVVDGKVMTVLTIGDRFGSSFVIRLDSSRSIDEVRHLARSVGFAERRAGRRRSQQTIVRWKRGVKPDVVSGRRAFQLPSPLDERRHEPLDLDGKKGQRSLFHAAYV